jgi:hypothetical protein
MMSSRDSSVSSIFVRTMSTSFIITCSSIEGPYDSSRAYSAKRCGWPVRELSTIAGELSLFQLGKFALRYSNITLTTWMTLGRLSIRWPRSLYPPCVCQVACLAWRSAQLRCTYQTLWVGHRRCHPWRMDFSYIYIRTGPTETWPYRPTTC